MIRGLILESLAPIVRPAEALRGGALSPKLGRRRSFISLGRELGGEAARMATRSALADIARDLGIPEADIEAAIDRAIKTADER